MGKANGASFENIAKCHVRKATAFMKEKKCVQCVQCVQCSCGVRARSRAGDAAVLSARDYAPPPSRSSRVALPSCPAA